MRSTDVTNSNFDALLDQNLEQYSNKWVAVAGKKIIASGKNFKKVYEEAKKKAPKEEILVGKVPGKEVLTL